MPIELILVLVFVVVAFIAGVAVLGNRYVAVRQEEQDQHERGLQRHLDSMSDVR